MNKNQLRIQVAVVVLLLAGIACARPGQSAAPVINPVNIETSVAGTLQASATQTALNAAPLATEPPAGMKGATIEQVDGATKYTDYDAAFEVTIPVGWLAVRPNSEEFNAALANEGAVNSMLHDQMTADQSGYEANYDRLYAYILYPDIQKDVLFGFSKVTWDSNDTAPIDNTTMGKVVQELETSGGIPGFRASVVQIYDNGAVPMIEISGRWSMSDGQGGAVPFYTTIVFFKPSANSTARMTFTYLQDYQTQLSPDVKSIMGSIRLIEP